MSKGMERMLRRMLMPNADLRCHAVHAMADMYWHVRPESAIHSKYTVPQPKNHPNNDHLSALERSVSAVSTTETPPSVILDREVSKLMDVSLPWSSRSRTKENKENVVRPSHRDKENQEPRSIFSSAGHSRAKSQPKVAVPKGDYKSIKKLCSYLLTRCA